MPSRCRGLSTFPVTPATTNIATAAMMIGAALPPSESTPISRLTTRRGQRRRSTTTASLPPLLRRRKSNFKAFLPPQPLALLPTSSSPPLLTPAATPTAVPNGSAKPSASPVAEPSLHTVKRRYTTCSTTGAAAAAAAQQHQQRKAASKEEADEAEQRKEEEEELVRRRPPPSFSAIADAFAALGLVDHCGYVRQGCTAGDVKRAYRAMALHLHPDVAGGNEGVMQEANTAYQCIMSLGESEMAAFEQWLRDGGERLQMMTTTTARQRMAWLSQDLQQLMMVGWCTTFSALLFCMSYFYFASPTNKAAAVAAAPLHQIAAPAVVGSGADRPRLRVRECCRVDAAAVQTTRWMPAKRYASALDALIGALGVRFRTAAHGGPLSVSRVLNAVSRYVLAVALTVAACANTLLLQRILLRLLGH